MSISELKPLIKNEYLYLKSEKEKLLLKYPNQIRNKHLKVTIRTINAKLFIYSGLYNNNKTDYDRGIEKFKNSTIKMLELTENTGCKIIGVDSVKKLNDSEAIRQLGISLKEQYDELIIAGDIFFG